MKNREWGEEMMPELAPVEEEWRATVGAFISFLVFPYDSLGVCVIRAATVTVIRSVALLKRRLRRSYGTLRVVGTRSTCLQ